MVINKEAFAERRRTAIAEAVNYLEQSDRGTLARILATAPMREEFRSDPEALINTLRSAAPGEPGYFNVFHLALGICDQATLPGGNINFDDERFVEPQYLEAHRRRELKIDGPFGEHLGVVVATSTDVNWIDAGIAELVFCMWKAGIRTTESCQDLYYDGTKAFLGFATPQDLTLFLGLVVPEDGIAGGLWDRATGCNVATGTPDAKMWKYDLMPHITGRRVDLATYVEFPVTDIAEVTRRIKAYVES